MQLPRFLAVKRLQSPDKLDDATLKEARELARLRLEQCVADLRNPGPAINEVVESGMKTGDGWIDGECAHIPALKTCSVSAVSDEIIDSLRASAGRLMRVTFSDGVVQTVVIGTIDKAGFLHSSTDSADPQVFWTRFEDVNALEAAS